MFGHICFDIILPRFEDKLILYSKLIYVIIFRALESKNVNKYWGCCILQWLSRS